MKHSSVQVAIFIFFTTLVSVAHCQRDEGPRFQRFRCLSRSTTQKEFAKNSVLLQQYPLSAQIRELPKEDATLGAVLGKNEIRSLVYGKLIKPAPTLAPNAARTNVNALNIRLRRYAPDYAMVVRGNSATIFPASFVTARPVQASRMMNGDIVATFLEAPTRISSTMQPEKDRPKPAPLNEFFELCFQRNVNNSDGTFQVFGSLVPRHLARVEKLDFSELRSEAKTLQKQLLEINPFVQDQLASRFVVGVLHRKVRGFNVRFLFVVEDLGSFGSDGFYFRSLIQDSKIRTDATKLQQTWNSAYQKYSDIALRNGDSIELTTLEYVPLFSPALK